MIKRQIICNEKPAKDCSILFLQSQERVVLLISQFLTSLEQHFENPFSSEIIWLSVDYCWLIVRLIGLFFFKPHILCSRQVQQKCYNCGSYFCHYLQGTIFVFKKYSFLTALDLSCCVWAFPGGCEQGLFQPQCTGFSLGGVSCFRARALERQFDGCGAWTWLPGACGIFLDQGFNGCPLRCKAYS